MKEELTEEENESRPGSKRDRPAHGDSGDETVKEPPEKMATISTATAAAASWSMFTVRTPRAGTIVVAKYYPGKPEPKTPGFHNILIHTSGTNLGGDLSPYVLKDEHGQLLENVWQFSKVYAAVTIQRTPLHPKHYPDTIIWEHGEEVHLRDGQLTSAYWKWRVKGMTNPYAVRYPNGFHGRQKCLFSVWPDEKGDFQSLGYIDARKKIYCGEYARLAPLTPHFQRLKAMLASGVGLQLLEVDGPDPALSFPPYDQISLKNPGLPMCEATIKTLLNDPRKPFGHGYVIAALLLGGAEWLK